MENGVGLMKMCLILQWSFIATWFEVYIVHVEWESRAIFLTIYDDLYINLSMGYMHNIKPVRRPYIRVGVDL